MNSEIGIQSFSQTNLELLQTEFLVIIADNVSTRKIRGLSLISRSFLIALNFLICCVVYVWRFWDAYFD